MKRTKSIIRTNLMLSLGFGLIMGIIFPIYASFFVQYNSFLARVIFTVGCLIAGSLVGMGAYLITKFTILKVVDQVRDEMKVLSGDHADLTRKINVVSDDRVGRLPLRFNEFVEKIRNLVYITQKGVVEINTMGDKLQQSMNETHQSVEGIERVFGDIQSDQRGKRDSAFTVNEINEKLTLSVNTFEEGIREVDELFKELQQEITTQSKNYQSLIDNIREVASAHSESQKGDFFSLFAQDHHREEDSYRGLMEFVKSIEELANSTSVLAINASIEASRFGVQGEGFKVIAQEIRKVSGETESLSGKVKASLEETLKEIQANRQKLTSTRGKYDLVLKGLSEGIEKLEKGVGPLKERVFSIEKRTQAIGVAFPSLAREVAHLKESSLNSKRTTETLSLKSEDGVEKIRNIHLKAESIKEVVASTNRQVNQMIDALKKVADQVMTMKTAE